MKITNNFDIKDYKDKLIFIVGFSCLVFIIYYLMYTPIIELKNRKTKYKESGVEERKEKKIFEAGEKRYKRLEEELDKEKKLQEISQKRLRESGFLNLVEFEKYISDVAQKNILKIDTIGRVEKIETTDKIYIPYIISGDVLGILKFIEQLEKSKKVISLSETNSQLEILNGIGKLTCKISSNVLDKREKIGEEKREIIAIQDFVNSKIKSIKILKCNNKNYIILRYIQGYSEIWYQNKVVEKDNKKYKVVLENGDIYLKLTEK